MERIKSSEEYKAVKLLEKMTKNYSLNSEELHYAIILYNLITNLQNNNQKLKNENKKLKKRIELLEHYKTLYQSLKGQKEEFRKYLKKMLDDENDIFSVVRVKDVLSKLEESEGEYQ